MQGSNRQAAHQYLASALFVALALLSGAALVVTQRVRQGDDIVNTVRIDKGELAPDGATARIRFRLAEADDSGSVEIVRGPDEEVVDVLRASAPMPERRYRLRWDGKRADGRPASPGFYRVRVVLAEQDREIVVPGGVRVEEESAGERR